MSLRNFLKDQKGGNPLVASVILICGFLIFFIFYSTFSVPLRTIWGAAKEAAAPNTPNIWGNLNMVWLAIPIVAVIALVVWYFAKIHAREYEMEVRGI